MNIVMRNNESLRKIIVKYLGEYCGENNVFVEEIKCKILQNNKEVLNIPGIYIFVDDNTVYYIGESSNLYNRLIMHCRANIGGSEGVVRFLIYLLDDICSNTTIRNTNDVKMREKLIKELLKEFIGKLSIYIGYCRNFTLQDKDTRRLIEEYLRRELKPLLNP